MSQLIHYLNTDLDLVSPVDIQPLSDALEANGVHPLYPVKQEDEMWKAIFETYAIHTEPESSIADMLGVLEALNPELRSIWAQCTVKDFNIGYDCGTDPWAFNQRLSPGLLERIAAVGASVIITIYPERE